MSTTRRDFLKLLGALAASGVSGTFLPSGEAAETYKVLPWSGDNFTRGHELRDGQLPKLPDKADRSVDFVIVGGGPAGLSTAYFLGDQNYLLLEQYENTGGTSSGGIYKEIAYSRGAVCTGNEDGLKRQLFEDLDIKPAIIHADQTAWHSGGHWLRGITGDDKFHKEFKRLIDETNALLAKHDRKLSETTFASCLSGYDKPFLGLINNISNSFFGAGSDYVSADAGCFMIKALTTDSYVFDGGNSGITRALRSKIDEKQPGRVLTNCFVWAIKPLDKGASVFYSDGIGEVHRVDCKHVVVTVPPLVALRIIPDLPDATKASWRKLEYSAFVVANFCMPKKVLEYPYQSFADEPYPFCQMVMAEAPYQATGRYKDGMGSVLTVYHPFPHGPQGRAKLLMANKEEVAGSMVKQLSGLMRPLQNEIEAIDVTRWGHAVIVPKPSLAEVFNKTNQFTKDWITFAHSSAGGGQSLEGALGAARNAADRCLQIAGVHTS